MQRRNDILDRRNVLKSVGASAALFGFGIGSTSASTTASPTDENTVHISELSSDARDIFETALADGSYTQRRSLPKSLRTNQYVRTESKLYALNQQYSEIHKSRIRPEKAEPTANVRQSMVRRVNDLPAVAQQAVENALKNGETELVGVDQWVFGFDDYYVERGGEYYLLNFVHMDMPQYSLSPTVTTE